MNNSVQNSLAFTANYTLNRSSFASEYYIELITPESLFLASHLLNDYNCRHIKANCRESIKDIDMSVDLSKNTHRLDIIPHDCGLHDARGNSLIYL